MVVGNGLIANAFKKYIKDDSIVIFASGVSDSLQTFSHEFIREKKLLLQYLSPKRKLIYFSTCSLSDESLSNSQYIQHKKEIENLIAEKQEQYIIFRLPIIVGQSHNPYTLTNYFYNKIKGNKTFQVYRNSCRYLLDIDDALKIIKLILSKNIFFNETDGEVADGIPRNIPVTTLNKLSSANNWDQFNNILLKADVQGFELEVLEGAKDILPRVEVIILEVSLFVF